MFSGIVRHRGRVGGVDLRRGQLTIQTDAALVGRLRAGDSISVDGICLTVTKRARGAFSVDITPETVRRTHLKRCRPGCSVNLEQPVRLADLLHGHIVLGHVDGVGVVVRAGGDFRVSVPRALAKYCAYKGSITVNGVSLTIAAARGNLIRIALIPETLKRTNLGLLRKGSLVNIEVDVIARYAESLMRSMKRG